VAKAVPVRVRPRVPNASPILFSITPMEIGMSKLKVGDRVDVQKLETINASFIDIPFKLQITHLQFRRFSGCPVCTLHLQEFVDRHIELVGQGVREVAVFHSSKEVLREHEAVVPFAVIADFEKNLYQQFGVEKSLMSVLYPAVWVAVLKGVFKYGMRLHEKAESLIALPADFLIGKEGEVLACKYGKHADDSWSVDEVLKMVSVLA
jgi:peroxiredoxin